MVRSPWSRSSPSRGGGRSQRPENLTDSQAATLADLRQYHLKSVEARLLREDFQRFRECVKPKRAAKFLNFWCKEAMRSRLGPMKKVARSLRRHHDLILNWFRAAGTISSGVVEGFNGTAKTDHQKSVWHQNRSRHRIFPASHNGTPSSAGIHPQILLRRLP